jgi:tRNA(adenine34) deaminase
MTFRRRRTTNRMRVFPHLIVAYYYITMAPTLLAFYPSCGGPHHVPSRTRRKELTTTLVGMSRRRSGVGLSMPPLNDTNSAFSRRDNIFKILKRDVYPTIDLPFIENNYTGMDHYFMGLALQQAQYAWDKGEVPIGAVVVRECTSDDATDWRRAFQIISAGHNRVETDFDASAHAELLALRQGARNLQNWRFPPNSRLYSTLEPCPMCMASIQAFRIDHVVYGAPDNRLGAIKTHMELLSVARHPYHEVKSVTGGVREEECGDIVVQFFRERRRQKKEVQGRRKLLNLPLDTTLRNSIKKQPRWSRFMKALLRKK